MSTEKRQLYTIEFIIFISFIGMSIPYPILPFLFMNHYFENSLWLPQASTETNLLITLSIYPLGMFFGAFSLGWLSDRFGKKWILLLSLGCSAFCQAISCVGIVHDNYGLFMITRMLSGFFEGNISIARAAIVSIYRNEGENKKYLGRANAALTLGWMVGPGIGSILHNFPIHSSYITPILFSSCLAILAFIFTFFYFQEPTPSRKKTPVPSPKVSQSIFSPKILVLLFVNFILFLGVDSFYIFIPVYLATALHATPTILAIATSIVGTFNLLSNILLVPACHRRLTTLMTVICSATALSVCLLMLALFDPNFKMLLILPVIGSAIALIAPNLSAFLSIHLNLNKQGTLMGTLLSQRTLGTAVLAFIFAATTQFYSQSPFIIGALFLIGGIILVILYAWFESMKLVETV